MNLVRLFVFRILFIEMEDPALLIHPMKFTSRSLLELRCTVSWYKVNVQCYFIT